MRTRIEYPLAATAANGNYADRYDLALVQLTPQETSIGAASITAILSVTIGVVTARRAAYDRVMRTLDSISEGPVAKARHRIGGVWFAGEVPEQQDGWDPVEDLFTVLWAARRIDAVRQSLRWTSWIGGPKRLLRTSTTAWVEWWWQPDPAGVRRLHEVVQYISGAEVDPVDTEPVERLYKAWCGPIRRRTERLRDAREGASSAG